jgi:hypothetical protein
VTPSVPVCRLFLENISHSTVSHTKLFFFRFLFSHRLRLWPLKNPLGASTNKISFQPAPLVTGLAAVAVYLRSKRSGEFLTLRFLINIRGIMRESFLTRLVMKRAFDDLLDGLPDRMECKVKRTSKSVTHIGSADDTQARLFSSRPPRTGFHYLYRERLMIMYEPRHGGAYRYATGRKKKQMKKKIRRKKS